MTDELQSSAQWDDAFDVSHVVRGEGWRLLTEYTRTDPSELRDHVRHIAKQGWEVMGYPCFRNYAFMNVDLFHSSVYWDIVRLTQKGSSFLDLGCGLGQDLRCLVRDGAPPNRLIGLDVQSEYIELGYTLFQDRATLGAQFLVQDFFEDTPAIKHLVATQEIKAINSGFFMHLWDYRMQLAIAKRMIMLICAEEGVLITGVHFGRRSPGIWKNAPAGRRDMFLHNPDTLRGLWDCAAKETGTAWEFQVVIAHHQYARDIDPDGCQLRWVAVRK